MAYLDTANLAEDGGWQKRCFGVAINEGNPTPQQWAYANRALMITPEMIGAVNSALAGGMALADAAVDLAVITEGMILARYQYLVPPPA